MNSESECYGRMFPSILEMPQKEGMTGRVFGYTLDYAGQVAHNKSATVDREAWGKCLKCPELDGCFRLSEGALLMELALRTTPKSLY